MNINRTEASGSFLPKAMGIQQRLMLFLAIVLVPVLLIQALIGYDRFQDRKAEALKDNLEIARAVSRAVDALVKDVLHQELAIAIAATASPPLTASGLTRLLKASARDASAVNAFSWVGPEGRVLASSRTAAVGRDVSGRSFFKAIAAGREWAVDDLIPPAGDGGPVFYISRGLRNEAGKLMGVAVASVDPGKLDGVLTVERPGEGGISLIDSQGVLVYRQPRIDASWEDRDWLRYPAVQKALQGEEVTGVMPGVGDEGQRRLVAATPIRSIGWVAAAGRGESEVMQGIVSVLLWQGALFLGVAFASFLTAGKMARNLGQAVSRLHERALALGRGETDTAVEPAGIAELQALAMTFNQMAGQVRSRQAELERQYATAALEHRRLRAVLDALPVGVYIADAEGKLQETNAAVQVIWGGRTPLSEGPDQYGEDYRAWWPQTGQRVQAHEWGMARALAKGEVCTAEEMEIECFDNTRKVILNYALPIRDSSGRIAGGVALNVDISERKQIEELLRESEERYRQLFENMTEGFALGEPLLDEDGIPQDFRFIEANTAFEQQTGLAPESLGRPMTEVLPHLERHWIDTYGGVALSGNPVRFDSYNKDLDRHFDVYCFRPSPGRFAILFRDITERKRVEEERQQAAIRMQQESRETAVANRILAVFVQEEGEDLYARTLDIVLEAMESQHGVFGYIDDQGDLICPTMSRLFGQCEMEGKCICYTTEKWKGLWSRAMREQTALYTNEEAVVPAGHVPILNNIAVPIVFQGRGIGLFNLANKGAGYTEEDREFIEAVAARIAPVLYARIQIEMREKERRKAEEELRLSERRYRELADAMPQLVWTARPDGTVDYYNRRYREFGGIEPDGRRWEWAPVVHPEDLEATVSAWKEAVAKGRVYEIEHRVRRSDGSFRWFLSRSVPARDAEGRITRWYGTATDVDRRKRAEVELQRAHDELEQKVAERTRELIRERALILKSKEALAESEARYRSIGELIPFGLWICDPAGGVIYLSDSFLELVGMSLEECQKFGWTNRLPPEDVDRTLRDWKACTLSGCFWDYEHRIQGKDGRYRTILSRGVPIRNAQGEITSWAGINLDITGRKNAEEERKRHIARLERLNQELEEFSWIASHDLQEPLRKIQAFGSRLENKQNALGPETREDVRRMVRSAGRMAALVRALKNYSEVNRAHDAFEPVDLAQVVQEAASDLEIAIEEAGGRIEMADLPTLEVDRTQMRQLFQNLIGNAVKYARKGERPVVRITGSVEDGLCRIQVADNGIGFEERYLDKIFVPFQRLHGKSSPYEGTGMGLAICRKVVERHGGTITAQSTPGKGATFIVRLPLAQGKAG